VGLQTRLASLYFNLTSFIILHNTTTPLQIAPPVKY